MVKGASALRADEVEALARYHADHEDRGAFSEVLDTLVAEPRYEFHPLGVRLEGRERVRRYYERVRRHYAPRVHSATLLELTASASAAMLEYALELDLAGQRAQERLVVVLPVREGRFAGERIHSSETVLRLLLGEMLEEATPVPPIRS